MNGCTEESNYWFVVWQIFTNPSPVLSLAGIINMQTNQARFLLDT